MTTEETQSTTPDTDDSEDDALMAAFNEAAGIEEPAQDTAVPAQQAAMDAFVAEFDGEGAVAAPEPAAMPEVKQLIAQEYANDKAVSYKIGDLRGAVSLKKVVE